MKVKKRTLTALLKWIKDLKAEETMTVRRYPGHAVITLSLTTTKTRATSIETRLKRMMHELKMGSDVVYLDKKQVYAAPNQDKIIETRDTLYGWEISLDIDVNTRSTIKARLAS